MAAELPRPGVEVIQVFRSVSPTVITPTLVPCVVGVCKQIVDVVQTTSTGGSALNGEAVVPLQASFVAKAATGSPAKYGGLDGLDLVVSINHAPDLTVTFDGALLTPAQVVAQVRKALGDAGVTTATAEVVGTTQWRLRTFGANEFQSIEIRAASSNAVLAAFGLGTGRQYLGASYYSQDQLIIPQAAFPDPRKNLAQLGIDAATIRAFLFLGGSTAGLMEMKRDRSFLRNGLSSAAVRTGSVDLATLTYAPGGVLDTLTLILSINGAADLTVTFSDPTDDADVLAQINAVISAVATASLGVSNHLVITTTKLGPSASITIGAGTANATLGLTANTVTGTAAVASIEDGNGDAVTPLLQLLNTTLNGSGAAAVVTGTSVISSVIDGHTLIVDDGTGPQVISFLSAVSSGAILTQINAVVAPANGGHITATVNGSTHLVLTSNVQGAESIVRIVGGTALSELGLTTGTVVRGAPFAAKPGDELYVDGVFFANITQVAPGGVVDVVKIDKQVAIASSVGLSWYIVAKNLPAVNRPSPDLIVNADGSITVKNDLIRDVQGTVVLTSRAQLYISYKAVRQDVSALAKNPALLRFTNTTDLGSQLSPVNAENPLALGIYFALLNAPQTQVTGLGVDAATPAAPYGTVEAFTRAASFLEAYEVYAIAPLTHDASVAQVFNTHVSVMSDPANKGERICLFNPAQPTSKPDTLVASGVDGNSLSSNVFDTGVANLGSLLLAAGLDPTGSFLVADGLFLDTGDGKKYSVESISGSILTIKTSGFLPGDNDDGYYSVTAVPTLFQAPFAVRIRGASLTLTDGSVDKESLAVSYAAIASGFRNRRFWQVIPDLCAATLGGLEQILEGFYMGAAIAGLIGKQPPQQSFTNFPMTGFTRVIGSNGYLTERQLNICAGGGNYVVVQDEPGAPLISRMALTTDVTSIETRTDSITKVVDFTAKFMRRGLKNFIGRFNITQGFLDTLGHVIQGLLGFLAESGVLIGSHLNNIVQDENAPDTVLVDITLDVPFPCNYIRLTLVI